MSTVRPKKVPASVQRASRPDGQATRQHLLATAGEVFAERGFADATSKEICLRAGTPMASINYHFGSREALYEAVLLDAHRQIISVEELASISAAPGDPESRLRALLSHLIALATGPATPWGIRVMLREVMSPSAALPALVDKALRPKAELVLGLVGEVLGLPPHHPSVQRALAFSVLPCLFLLLAPRQVTTRLLPATQDPEGLAEEMLRYVRAGLNAMAAGPGAAG